ncbi:MAG: YggS family pyridoxal phosphate-dependent enzyme [Taibaiella sp.]|nr:YggS family pyridoxal phosphate-dependent enzyme [Taibaiella sp.]
MADLETWAKLSRYFTERNVTLIAVSKTKPAEDILELYTGGQRDFGENYVQELEGKKATLPGDIRWHFIGHLQTNKVKYIAPFVFLIHGVDNLKLLLEINRQALKNERVIDVLLQLYIAKEDTKFGFDKDEVMQLLTDIRSGVLHLGNIRICGFMGMASDTPDTMVIDKEFSGLHHFLAEVKEDFFMDKPEFNICSMGMSGDYERAISAGSTMVRIGSLLFGKRNYSA